MLQIAKILKSNGTDGDVLIGFVGIDPNEIETKEPVFIHFDELPVPFFFEKFTLKGDNRAIVHLSGVDSLQDAEEIVGREVFSENFEDETEGPDFTGWVITDKGREVGVVDGFEDIPGNPCLCIGETLIPLHEDFIVSLDEKKKIIEMDLPEGLL